MTHPRPPRIALTPGEPAGIGPDLCVQLAQQGHLAQIVMFADPALLLERAQQLGLPLQIREFTEHDNAPQRPGVITVIPVSTATPVTAGQLDKRNSDYVLDCLTQAIDACRQQHFDALVTGPVHKGIINDAGIAFSGHTEFLAQRTGAELPVMMLQTEALRVALVTTHLPLKDVSTAITRERLQRVLHILHHDLQHRFGITAPRLFICGLNPHAGEDGHLGREEIDTITPVVEQCRGEGMELIGPLSADTIFSQRNRDQADAFVAMYHDQGLPVLKTLGFGQAVNVTLGLPIVRTSVDHGTALELVGSGEADGRSLELALQVAIDICHHQRKPNNN
jgi:4-hydroxythreonine-4-phosphate dehydrogenase